MPVYVERPAQLTDQDRQDLLNVYADAPNWLLPPFADGAALIEQSLADGSLRVARFNGRLLGAARLQPGGNFLRLSHLCVRALTRGRGVARRLVDEARREAQQQDLLLVLAADPAQEAAEQLAAHLMLPLRAL
jgi:ribosomal protein S18 acetylase RimI-like enzyme